MSFLLELLRHARLIKIAGLIALLAAGAVAALRSIDAPPLQVARWLGSVDEEGHPAWAALGGEVDSMIRTIYGDAVPALSASEPPSPARDAAAHIANPATNPPPSQRTVDVRNESQLRGAIEKARAGDRIVLAPGTYRVGGAKYLAASAIGSELRPIVVRAERAGSVVIESTLIEGILVSGPHWRFENLTIRGTCNHHSACEHAFHVVGDGTHFRLNGSTLIDFNAPIKANGQGGRAPDAGVVERSHLYNTTARRTDSPVTLIDLVGVSGWVVRQNRLIDFAKDGGDRISYGAFAKGGGSAVQFVGNIVICEHRVRGTGDQRVGLSLGGGGTQAAFCPGGDCSIEHTGGRIESNLVLACSDDGIYLNRAADSKVLHNTLIGTGPITLHHAQSTARVAGNLLDTWVRVRGGAVVHASDNRDTGIVATYLGHHPVRSLFRDVGSMDLRWKGTPAAKLGGGHAAGPRDLCTVTRKAAPRIGAFDDFAPCLSSVGSGAGQ